MRAHAESHDSAQFHHRLIEITGTRFIQEIVGRFPQFLARQPPSAQALQHTFHVAVDHGTG